MADPPGLHRMQEGVRQEEAQWRGTESAKESQHRIEELTRSNAELLGFAHTVAHDLKNPLGVILGRTEMLTELIGAGSSKESVTAQVEHIRDATRRLTSMVDHLISDAMADAFDISIRR